MGHDDVRAGLREQPRLLRVEGVGRGEQVELMGGRDAIDLQGEAHARLFEVRPEEAVDQPDRREVLDAGEPHLLELAEE